MQQSPPPSLTTPPPGPVALPPRGLSQRETEIYWGRDRSGYRQCIGQLEGLTAWTLPPQNRS
ncbi:MAG: hypothetical protein DI533_04735 [Cereibacter sphaeroides]|uniref:Uncharacterized protein n=1 Tax=Cereibacter sphaeroides TaxID=1063 RepID=A0A2W5SCW6_CERSP|nr:MAG: hypothetical protein DI533_04735 [Cereibacter sphaeroides]